MSLVNFNVIIDLEEPNFSSIDICIIYHNIIKQHFQCFRFFCWITNKNSLKLQLDGNLWVIWNKKNKIIFKNERVDAIKIFTLGFSCFDWCFCPMTCLKSRDNGFEVQDWSVRGQEVYFRPKIKLWGAKGNPLMTITLQLSRKTQFNC